MPTQPTATQRQADPIEAARGRRHEPTPVQFQTNKAPAVPAPAQPCKSDLQETP